MTCNIVGEGDVPKETVILDYVQPLDEDIENDETDFINFNYSPDYKIISADSLEKVSCPQYK